MSALPLLCTDSSRVLILGSMPGKKSLDLTQYYAHPQNAFWSIVFDCLSQPVAQAYTERLAALTTTHIALWDVLADCQRPGSLDSKIVRGSEVFNPLDELIDSVPNLRAVFFNGQTAQSLFDKRFKDLRKSQRLAFIALPSTSPAHAALTASQKSIIWRNALAPYIDVERPN